ncbi:hypothetical protein MKC53_24705, partial [[Clostridium] innocuum]|nr:hypothetical protein [[Clostridium] innocuum]
MQLVLAQVSDAEALQRYEDVCKDAEETDVLPFRLQYADMSAFLKAQTDWHIGANLPEGVVSSSLYLVRQHGEVVATLVLRHELNAYLRKFIGHIGSSTAETPPQPQAVPGDRQPEHRNNEARLPVSPWHLTVWQAVPP